MSRTIKDQPAWLYAENRVGKTDRESAGNRRRGTARRDRAVRAWEWHSCWRNGVDCDIDEPDNIYRGSGRSQRTKAERRWHCERHYYRVSYGFHCPSWLRKDLEDVVRSEVREQCDAARHEANSGGEIDTYPATDQHRHSGAWWD